MILSQKEITNSDNQPRVEVGWSSGDQRTVFLRIPSVSHARNEEGDALCMHSVDVSAECTTSVNLPQDSHSRNSIGSMQLSILPRDQASDTLNNSNLNLSRVSPFDINENIQENLPRDDNISNHPFNSSSRGTPLPRDALSPNIPNLSSSNVIQPRDEDSNASHQPDSFQPILIQSGSSQPNLNIANSNQVYFKQANDSNLASNIHHASTEDIPCSKIKEISHSSKTESP